MDRRFITIVSGLPRSGTSMMMQVLEAGGIPPVTDNVRKPDEDNPRGYYELESVKRTRQAPSWLGEATGKAVKVVYRLVYDLPMDREYRVVFMKRSLREVIASQNAMLRRRGQAVDGDEADGLLDLFTEETERFEQWTEMQDCLSLLPVLYGDMIQRPGEQVQRINEFLGGGLNESAMAAVVDPALYRHRE